MISQVHVLGSTYTVALADMLRQGRLARTNLVTRVIEVDAALSYEALLDTLWAEVMGIISRTLLADAAQLNEAQTKALAAAIPTVEFRKKEDPGITDGVGFLSHGRGDAAIED